MPEGVATSFFSGDYSVASYCWSAAMVVSVMPQHGFTLF